MKKTLIISLLLVFAISAVFAGGQQEAAEDRMVIRVAEQVPNLITPGVWDGQAFSLNASIYDYLVEIDHETGELVPSLATSWNVSEDGRTWTLELREGVTFHDGSEFTAEDAVFTIERTQDEDLGHLKAQDFENVENVKAIDDYTVEITLDGPSATFIYQLTDYNMAVLSADYDYEQKGEMQPMGTGPFVLEELRSKESALLSKNQNYWNEGLPKADELRIYFVPDIDASVSMLEADEVDIVPQISPSTRRRLESMEGFKVVSPYQESRFVAMRTDKEPFDDNRVRLAFKYAVDPEILAKACQGTLGETIYYNETPIVNSLAQYHEIPNRGRDIDKAKELLDEAGYEDGVTVDFHYASDHPYGSDIAQALKELVEPAGFELDLQGSPRDIYLSQHWLEGTLQLTGWGVRVDPSMLLMLAFHSEGPWNESHLDNSEVDRLTETIRKEVDDQKRMEYYAQLQEVFYEEGPLLNIQVPYLVALSENLKDYRQPITMLPQLEYATVE
ncbi:MAG: ABC transporter substrate-binding protein [Spirochaetota bacterium]